jgi:hypothetical protein
VERVSKTLGVTPETLISNGVEEYLKTRPRIIQTEIHESEIKYKVNKPAELQEQIKQGKIEEHPTWEDLIHYENLIERAEKIKHELDKINR